MRTPLDPTLVSAGLVTSDQPWRGVEFHPAIASTNTRLARLLASPGPEADTPSAPGSYAVGLHPGAGAVWGVVLTDHQTGGRGRLGRVWEVPDRASVAVSAAVPVADPAGAGWLPLLAGVALARAVRAVSAESGNELTPRLKWPNDVLLADDDDRKVSGILCELVTVPGRPAGPTHVVVVGTGVNVDQRREELPVDTATSLALAGAVVRREDVVVRHLRELGALLPLVDAGAAGEVVGPLARDARDAYRQECSTLGQRVRVQLPDGSSVEGDAVAVDEDGALVVETPLGRRAFAAGDVLHVRRR